MGVSVLLRLFISSNEVCTTGNLPICCCFVLVRYSLKLFIEFPFFRDFVCSLFPKAILFDFYFTLLYLVLCRVAAVKSFPVHHHSAGYILFLLGSLSYFENRIPLKPALGSVCSLANYSDAYEETQSNRVSVFRDFVCSLFPKAILFYFYSQDTWAVRINAQ